MDCVLVADLRTLCLMPGQEDFLPCFLLRVLHILHLDLGSILSYFYSM